jgi:protein-disulfide isomerase
MLESKEEKKESKQLFAITTDNVWKITTVALAIFVVVFIARDIMRDDVSPDIIKPDSAQVDDSNNDVEFSDVAVSDDDRVKGDDDAPVTIVEYSDFQCPYCQRFYSQTLSSIEENYISTGKVRFVYRHFPLSFHQNAQIAAEAAECAGDQDMFWEMHDMIFEKGSADGSGLGRSDLETYAATLGMDAATFSACLDAGTYTDKVANDMAMGASQGVSGTPGFIINGVLVSGAQPYSVFEQVIEAALASQ